MTMEAPGDSTEANVRLRYRYLKQAIQEHGVTLDTNTRVLEVGSGNGLMLKQFENDGVKVVAGADMRPRADKDTLQVATRIEQLPFADDSFDIVTSTQAFDAANYDQDQEKMGAEIVRVLKEGGLYISFAEMMENIPQGLTLVSDPLDRGTSAVYKKEKSPV